MCTCHCAKTRSIDAVLRKSASTPTTVNQPTTRHASDEGPEETQIVRHGIKKQGYTHVADNNTLPCARQTSPAPPCQVQPARYHYSSIARTIYWIQPRRTHRSLRFLKAPLPAFPIFIPDDRKHDERAGGMSGSIHLEDRIEYVMLRQLMRSD